VVKEVAPPREESRQSCVYIANPSTTRLSHPNKQNQHASSSGYASEWQRGSGSGGTALQQQQQQQQQQQRMSSSVPADVAAAGGSVGACAPLMPGGSTISVGMESTVVFEGCWRRFQQRHHGAVSCV